MLDFNEYFYAWERIFQRFMYMQKALTKMFVKPLCRELQLNAFLGISHSYYCLIKFLRIVEAEE